jgi:hypothetical protein
MARAVIADDKDVVVYVGTPEEVAAMVRLHRAHDAEVRETGPKGPRREVAPAPASHTPMALSLERVVAIIPNDDHVAIYKAIYAASPERNSLRSYVRDLDLPERTAGGFIVAMQAAARKLGCSIDDILGRAVRPQDGITVVWVPFRSHAS